MFAANFFSTYTSMMLMCTVQGWILMTEFMGSFWFCLHSLPKNCQWKFSSLCLAAWAWAPCPGKLWKVKFTCSRNRTAIWWMISVMFNAHQQPHRHKYIPYREKTFVNFKVLWLFSFLHENLIFHQFTKVFYWKRFPLYDSPIPVKHAIPIS